MGMYKIGYIAVLECKENKETRVFSTERLSFDKNFVKPLEVNGILTYETPFDAIKGLYDKNTASLKLGQQVAIYAASIAEYMTVKVNEQAYTIMLRDTLFNKIMVEPISGNILRYIQEGRNR